MKQLVHGIYTQPFIIRQVEHRGDWYTTPSELSACYVGISFYKTLDEAQTTHEHGTGIQ